MQFKNIILSCWLVVVFIPKFRWCQAKNHHHKKCIEIDNLIIIVGLPKSGTTSIHSGLLELGIKSAHWEVPDKLCSRVYPVDEVIVGMPGDRVTWDKVRKADRCYIGVLIQKAISNDLPPLEYITDAGYQAIAQMDVCYPKEDLSIFPQVDAIEILVRAYPTAYFIHTRRASLASHVASMAAWHRMLDRLKDAGWLDRFEGQSYSNTDLENGEIMIEGMTNLTVSVFAKYPDVKFLDITIEAEDAADQVAAFLGLSSFPLEHANSGHYNRHYTAAPTPSSFVDIGNADASPSGDDEGDDDGDDDDDECEYWNIER